MKPQPDSVTLPCNGDGFVCASLRVGIYCRLSRDRDGDKASIARQEADARALAVVKGWTISDVYIDRDKSASKEDVTRPEFERLKRDVQAGLVDVVVCWKWDRLSRLHLVSEMFRRDAEKAGVSLVSVMEPDAGDATSDLARRFLSIIAEQEAKNTSVRVRAAMESAAKAGRWNGGGVRAYGYTSDRSAIVPEEAQLIREAADRIIRGDSIRAIIRDWEARGVNRSASGKGWEPANLSRTLKRPYLAGLREHHGEIVAQAEWKPILPRKKWERVRAILDAPERRTIETNARAYLLSGILHCGICGQPMVGRPWISPTGERRPRYICRKDPHRGSCGKIAQNAAQLDDFVCRAIVREITRGKLLARMLRLATEEDKRSAQLMESIRDDEAQLTDLASMYADRAISKQEYLTARKAVSARLEASRAASSAASGSSFLASIPTDEATLLKRWANADLVWRRRLVYAVLERVEIGPKRPGSGNAFDQERVSVLWRDRRKG